MEEQLVTFDIAKLAKEKGFDEYCINSYLNSSKETYSHLSQGIVSIKKHGYLKRKSLERKNSDMANAIDERFSAPTQSLLQKWIREVHGIDVIALPTSSSKYIFRLYQKGKTCKNQIYGAYMSKEYANYEEALGKGLQESLKLI